MINILYFGVIRSFKGVEDLVAAFELLDCGKEQFWLTVVGETWGGQDLLERVLPLLRSGIISLWLIGTSPTRRHQATSPDLTLSCCPITVHHPPDHSRLPWLEGYLWS